MARFEKRSDRDRRPDEPPDDDRRPNEPAADGRPPDEPPDDDRCPGEPPDRVAVREAGGGPSITAELQDGPLEGRAVEAEVVEGRPPKTIDVEAGDGSTCRYCLAQWAQAGQSAAYTFLYEV